MWRPVAGTSPLRAAGAEPAGDDRGVGRSWTVTWQLLAAYLPETGDGAVYDRPGDVRVELMMKGSATRVEPCRPKSERCRRNDELATSVLGGVCRPAEE